MRLHFTRDIGFCAPVGYDITRKAGKRLENFAMIRGYHVVFGAYGFWLPNDPRGSWSASVQSWELARFGPATKTNVRRSLAGQPHDREARLEAKQALKYPAVQFTGIQARAAGRGFGIFASKSDLVVWARAILPDHVHLVVGPHRTPVAQMANQLKGAATRQMVYENVHPLAAYTTRSGRPPKAWARGEWKVFLWTEVDIRRAICYVENNPVNEGKPAQSWPFVTKFEGLEPQTSRSPAGRG